MEDNIGAVKRKQESEAVGECFEEQQIEEVLSQMGKTGEVSQWKELSDTNICMWTFFCKAAILHYSCAELRRMAYGSEESRVVQE